MVKQSYFSEDIHCDGCANSIKRSLGKLPGVTEVGVDVEQKRVDVAFDESQTNEQAIKDRLAMAGFPVK
jgi:copper chaperone CopZ